MSRFEDYLIDLSQDYDFCFVSGRSHLLHSCTEQHDAHVDTWAEHQVWGGPITPENCFELPEDAYFDDITQEWRTFTM